MKNFKIKNYKGITLIALIITIIVLLILAVVTIKSVTDNGIISKAQEAKNKYQNKKENELMELAEYDSFIEEHINLESNHAFNSITALNYGDSIAYSKGGVSDWKIFYKDANYIYIITSDYLLNTNLPVGLKMSSTPGGYGTYWNSKSDITSNDASTITSNIASKYKLDWIAGNETSTEDNARATADLLNTVVWTEKFGDISSGIEAIGSPTLDMWIASWNEKGYTSLKKESNQNGYCLGKSSMVNLKDKYSITLTEDDIAGCNDTLYFLNKYESSGCYGYWLSSPSAHNGTYMIHITYKNNNFDIGYDGYPYQNCSIRPIVAIPSNLITPKVDNKWGVKLVN